MLEPMKNLYLAMLSVLVSGCGPSMELLHNRATRGESQDDAPVHARQQVVIHAPRDVVWATLTTVADWPRWQTGVVDATPPRDLAAENDFSWRHGSNTIHATLALVEAPKTLAWTGSVAVAKAIHIWRLDAVDDATTTVSVDESMDGFLLTLFYGQHDLERDMLQVLVDLKTAAEAKR